MWDMKKIEEMARADGWKPPTINDIEDKNRTCEKCGISWEIVGNENGLLPQGYGTCPNCDPTSAAYRICNKCNKTYISAMQYGSQDRITECPHCASKKGCFIATAAAGYNSWEVRTLKGYRDQVLLHYRVGICSIRIYYKFSPYIAQFISNRPILKYITYKYIIKPLATFISLFINR